MQVRRPLSTARGVPVQELRDFWRNVACVAVQTTSVVAVATTCCDEDNMDPVLDSLVAIALDLTSALSADDRHDRLVGSVHRALPCDSAALMRRDGAPRSFSMKWRAAALDPAEAAPRAPAARGAACGDRPLLKADVRVHARTGVRPGMWHSRSPIPARASAPS